MDTSIIMFQCGTMTENTELSVTEYFKMNKQPVYPQIEEGVAYYSEIQKIINMAKTWLMFRAPFFQYMASQKQIIVTQSAKITNVVTDFRYIYYPYDSMKQSIDQYIGKSPDSRNAVVHELAKEIVHQILHMALYHHERFKAGGSFNQRLYKIAADITVFFQMEDMMEKFKQNSYGADWVLPDMKQYERFKGKNTNQIYKILYDELPKDQDQGQSPADKKMDEIEADLAITCGLEQFSDIVGDM